jgi:hypothetical protein
MMRLFNGEPNVELLESCFTVLQISSILGSNKTLDSVNMAVQQCIEHSLQVPFVLLSQSLAFYQLFCCFFNISITGYWKDIEGEETYYGSSF